MKRSIRLTKCQSNRYIIIRNGAAGLVETESRDPQYKQILPPHTPAGH